MSSFRRGLRAAALLGTLTLATAACAGTTTTSTVDPAPATVGPTRTTVDPAPTSDTPVHFRETDRSGCPARLVVRDDGTVELPAPRRGTAADLAPQPATGPVPVGAVAARVCRYTSMDDGRAGTLETTPNLLAQQATVGSPAQVATLVAELDDGGRWTPGTYSCPADFAVHELVLLTYPDASRLAVLVSATGCATVSTARSAGVAIFGVSAALVSRLIALAGRWAPNL